MSPHYVNNIYRVRAKVFVKLLKLAKSLSLFLSLSKNQLFFSSKSLFFLKNCLNFSLEFPRQKSTFFQIFERFLLFFCACLNWYSGARWLAESRSTHQVFIFSFLLDWNWSRVWSARVQSKNGSGPSATRFFGRDSPFISRAIRRKQARFYYLEKLQ